MEGLNHHEIIIKEFEEDISYYSINHAVKEWIEIDHKKIPLIDTKLNMKDYMGTTMVRLGIDRYNYKIPSGLYAVGKVDENSPVLVTANYKLTFDALRKELDDRGFWILVLDTQGINVWCAAGKGTFGSRELIYQIHKWGLNKIVKGRKLILPQLGAASMEPHLIKKYTGFTVIYGPVRSKDIIKFIDNGYTADEEMRRVWFNLKDRMVLTPIEIILNMKYILLFFLYFMILNFIMGGKELLNNTLYNVLPFMMANLTGSLIFPMILPMVPLRSFSLNGGFLGMILGGYIIKRHEIFRYSESLYFKLGIFLLLVGFTAYTSFNFTGSTTYTSFSGVKKETKIFLPILLAMGAVGILLTLVGIF